MLAALIGGASAGAARGDGTETLGPPAQIALARGSGIVAAGTGLFTQPSTVTIAVPPGSSVRQVLVYWEGQSFVPDAGDATLVINGQVVTGAPIGGPTVFFTDRYTGSLVQCSSFRADITSLGIVGPGLNSLVLQGLSFSFRNNGAGVLVIHDQPSAAATIAVLDGEDLAFRDFLPPLDATVARTFTFPPESVDRTADLALFVASVEPGRSSSIEVRTEGVTSVFSSALGGVDGAEWDTFRAAVPVPAGIAAMTVEIFSRADAGDPGFPASLGWVGAALSVPTCDDGDPCTLDTGEPGMGCQHQPYSGPCDDADACTSGDVCADGSCAGQPIDCDDANVCTNDSCDPSAGCVHPPIDCEDGNACTEDACDPIAGCTHGPVDCDDANLCTTDSCDPSSGCTHAAIGGPCDDADGCTSGDVCTNGSCTGQPVDCGDANACTVDACDPVAGCTHGPPDCDDANACTMDSCDPSSGCAHAAVGGTCDDADACTSGDACTDGACSGQPVDCGDANACTNDTCDPSTGCVHSPSGCEDQDPCTADACDPVAGCTHGPPDCDDANVCTTDSCDPSSGCAHAAAQGPCDDADACTMTDLCQVGACVGGDPVVCGPGDQCLEAGVCLPATGQCMNPAMEDGTMCRDGQPVTTRDACGGGLCIGGFGNQRLMVTVRTAKGRRGLPIPGVVVALVGPEGPLGRGEQVSTGRGVTDALCGQVEFARLGEEIYAVNASKPGCRFRPDQASVDLRQRAGRGRLELRLVGRCR